MAEIVFLDIDYNTNAASNGSFYEQISDVSNLNGLCLNYQLSVSVTNVVTGDNTYNQPGPTGSVVFEQGPSNTGPWTSLLPANSTSGSGATFSFEGDYFQNNDLTELYQVANGREFIQYIRVRYDQTSGWLTGNCHITAAVLFDCGCGCSNT